MTPTASTRKRLPLAEPGDLRVLNGLYLTSWQLGQKDAARDAFGKLVASGLELKRLPVKLLFQPGKTTFNSVGDLPQQYSLWINTLAEQTGKAAACVRVVGHTSRTGSARGNEVLSRQRAEAIQKMLEASNRTLGTRLTAAGVGSREALVGLGTDDHARRARSARGVPGRGLRVAVSMPPASHSMYTAFIQAARTVFAGPKARLLFFAAALGCTAVSAAQPDAFTSRTCVNCHNTAVNSAGNTDCWTSLTVDAAQRTNLQCWSGQHSGLDSSNFVTRLTNQGGVMAVLAADGTATGIADRAAILQYLLDVRDGKVKAIVGSSELDTLNLGTVAVGASASGVIRITNERNRSITYAAPSLANGTVGFSVSSETCATRVVAAGSICDVTIAFAPSQLPLGDRSTTVTISATGSGGDVDPQTRVIALVGNASSPISLASSVAFPAAAAYPWPGSLLISNSRASAVRLVSLDISPADNFSLATTPTVTPACSAGADLAGNSSCTVNLLFNPTQLGNPQATLAVTYRLGASDVLANVTLSAVTASQGQLALGALSLNFPDTELTSTRTLSFIARNIGTSDLTFTAFERSGAAAGNYQTAGTCSTSSPLAPAAECTIEVAFTPTAVGARDATLSVRTNGINPQVDVSLSGTGSPAVPRLTLSPPPPQAGSLDFGPQTLGGLYPTRNVRVTSTGTAAVSVTAVAVNGSAFARENPSSCSAALAPGAFCDVSVRFTPAAADTDYSGAVVVTSNAQSSPHSMPLAGRGVTTTVPIVVLSPAVSQLDFGDVTAGTASPIQSVTVLNQGPGGVTLSVVNAVGADASVFGIDTTDPLACQAGRSLFQGESCRLDVRFVPGAAGARSASVQIASNGSSPPALSVVGTGVGVATAGVSLSANTVGFGATRVGTQTTPVEVVITGSGTASVRIAALSVTGPFAMQSTTCASPPFTLSAGASCSVVVSFLPQSAGAASGTLVIENNGNPARREVALSGQGEAAADVGSGGCSLAQGHSADDPTLWMLVVLAMAALVYRRRARTAARACPIGGRRP